MSGIFCLNGNWQIATLRILKRSVRSIPLLYVVAKIIQRFYKRSLRYIRYQLSGRERSIQNIRALVNQVEYYQPLYRLSIIDKEPQRPCTDRADAIYQYMKPWGTGARILDIGCSLGYFSYYFAERGYCVSGIDSNVDNIAVCRSLQTFNEKVDFSVNTLSFDFVKKISPYQYDILFLFSVIHHVIYKEGLPYAQELICELLEKIPILFIELAVKEEETTALWVKSLPDDALAIFEKCSDITIQKIEDFSTHLSIVKRPLYMIKKDTQLLLGKKRKVYQQRFNSYPGARETGHRYYDCGEVYIKKYRLDGLFNTLSGILQEVDHYRCLPANIFFPVLLSYQQQENSIELEFEKMPGENLHVFLSQEKSIPRFKIFLGILEGLIFLHQQGLYHNDVRLWNILWDEKKIYLLDLEKADKKEKENTNLALLWIIKQCHCFRYYRFPYPITAPPVLDLTQLQPEFLPFVQALQNTSGFKDFLEWYVKRDSI